MLFFRSEELVNAWANRAPMTDPLTWTIVPLSVIVPFAILAILAIAQTPPGAGPPPHVHHRDDEIFVVLEGELSFLTATGWIPAPQGSVIYAPREAPHTFRNVGASPSRHVVLTLPSGFDEFYARCSELFAAEGSPDPRQLRAVAADYGYEFLVPGALPSA